MKRTPPVTSAAPERSAPAPSAGGSQVPPRHPQFYPMAPNPGPAWAHGPPPYQNLPIQNAGPPNNQQFVPYQNVPYQNFGPPDNRPFAPPQNYAPLNGGLIPGQDFRAFPNPPFPNPGPIANQGGRQGPFRYPNPSAMGNQGGHQGPFRYPNPSAMGNQGLIPLSNPFAPSQNRPAMQRFMPRQNLMPLNINPAVGQEFVPHQNLLPQNTSRVAAQRPLYRNSSPSNSEQTSAKNQEPPSGIKTVANKIRKFDEGRKSHLLGLLAKKRDERRAGADISKAMTPEIQTPNHPRESLGLQRSSIQQDISTPSESVKDPLIHDKAFKEHTVSMSARGTTELIDGGMLAAPVFGARKPQSRHLDNTGLLASSKSQDDVVAEPERTTSLPTKQQPSGQNIISSRPPNPPRPSTPTVTLPAPAPPSSKAFKGHSRGLHPTSSPLPSSKASKDHSRGFHPTGSPLPSSEPSKEHTRGLHPTRPPPSSSEPSEKHSRGLDQTRSPPPSSKPSQGQSRGLHPTRYPDGQTTIEPVEEPIAAAILPRMDRNERRGGNEEGGSHSGWDLYQVGLAGRVGRLPVGFLQADVAGPVEASTTGESGRDATSSPGPAQANKVCPNGRDCPFFVFHDEGAQAAEMLAPSRPIAPGENEFCPWVPEDFFGDGGFIENPQNPPMSIFDEVDLSFGGAETEEGENEFWEDRWVQQLAGLEPASGPGDQRFEVPTFGEGGEEKKEEEEEEEEWMQWINWGGGEE
ncbi:hypothetical protein TWF718_002816 [Orbilia javanica]|uniref:Uncharacterized protein n=1 Tax=Orbilia javanica TaxID=47235 RepID=A0AAN8R970_9PEZI